MDKAENPIPPTAEIDERREMPRCLVDAPTTMVVLAKRIIMVGRMTQLSLSDCCIVLPKTLSNAASAAVECTFQIRGVGFRLEGIIESVEDTLATVYFHTMSSRSRDDLMEVLCEVALENSARLPAQGNAGSDAPDDITETDDPAIETILAEEAARNGVQPRRDTVAWNPFAGMASGTKQSAPQSRSGPQSGPISPGAPASAQVQGMAAGNASSAAAGAAPTPAPEKAAAGNPSAPHPKRGRDRRASQRCYIDTSAVVELINIGSKLNGKIVDLSVGGCRIKTPEKFPVGIYTRVEIEFQLSGLLFRMGGVIQAVHDSKTVGIRFLDMGQRKKDQVAELVADIVASGGG
jgi:hypothetical protein